MCGYRNRLDFHFNECFICFCLCGSGCAEEYLLKILCFLRILWYTVSAYCIQTRMITFLSFSSNLCMCVWNFSTFLFSQSQFNIFRIFIRFFSTFWLDRSNPMQMFVFMIESTLGSNSKVRTEFQIGSILRLAEFTSGASCCYAGSNNQGKRNHLHFLLKKLFMKIKY